MDPNLFEAYTRQGIGTLEAYVNHPTTRRLTMEQMIEEKVQRRTQEIRDRLERKLLYGDES